MESARDSGEAPLSGGERGWGEGGLRHRTTASHTERARFARGEQTEAEARLWSALRGHRLNGWKFRRQVPIGRYRADFVCPAGRLIVEVDGSQHVEQADYDAARTRFFETQGYRVVRFWNNQVVGELDRVLEAIRVALPRDHPLPNPSPLQGEGL